MPQCVKKKKEKYIFRYWEPRIEKVVTTGTDLVYSHGTVGYSTMITHVKTLTCEKLNLNHIFKFSHFGFENALDHIMLSSSFKNFS